MKAFMVDPSLTCSGWCMAEIDGRSFEVLHVGRVQGEKTGDEVDRSRTMAMQLVQVCLNWLDVQRDRVEIVIERPSGRVTMRNKGGGSGLSVYGFTVGKIHERFETVFGEHQVHAPQESVWTGSRSKKVRQAIAFQHYPALKRMSDPGMDISDAVALCVWWAQVGRHKRRGADA